MNAAKSKWNASGWYQRAAALLDRLPWQVHASARIALLGPPAASLILLGVYYFRYCQAVPFDPADFLDAFLLFAVPVGYAFGAVPALLTASLYCSLLTADSRLRQRGLGTRVGAGALCGGLMSSVWFRELTHTDWGVYGLTGALVMAALALSSPALADARASSSMSASRSLRGAKERNSNSDTMDAHSALSEPFTP